MGIYCLSRSISGVAALAFAAGLGLSSSASAGPSSDAGEDHEIQCLALTIYYEARGEPQIGKLAVGHVVMNRARSGAFPGDVCDVVRDGGQRRNRCQFSWYCDGISDRPRDAAALRESLQIARAIYEGCTADPSNGALFFHATTVRPAWRKWAGRGVRIGGHMFYRGRSPASLQLASATGDDRPDAAPDSCVGAAAPPAEARTVTRSVAAPKDTETATRSVAAPKDTETAARSVAAPKDTKASTRPDLPPTGARIAPRSAPRGSQLTALPPALPAQTRTR
jgi:hypothetical protein